MKHSMNEDLFRVELYDEEHDIWQPYECPPEGQDTVESYAEWAAEGEDSPYYATLRFPGDKLRLNGWHVIEYEEQDEIVLEYDLEYIPWIRITEAEGEDGVHYYADRDYVDFHDCDNESYVIWEGEGEDPEDYGEPRAKEHYVFVVTEDGDWRVAEKDAMMREVVEAPALSGGWGMACSTGGYTWHGGPLYYTKNFDGDYIYLY